MPEILSAVLALSVLLFGSVEVWSADFILFLVYTLGLVWILKRKYVSHRLAGEEKAALAALAAFLFYTALQVIPLPLSLVQFLSASAYDLYEYSPGRHFIPLSVYPYKTLSALLNSGAYATVFIISMYFSKDDENLSKLMKILSVFGFCVAVFALIQKAAWNGKIYWFRILTLGGEPFGPFVNRNHFAGLVNMIIPLSLGLALETKTGEKRILFGFFALIMTVALFLSLSRGGIISFFGGISLLALLRFNNRSKKIWLVGLFITLAALYVCYLGAGPIVERFYHTEISHESRLAVWSAAIRACQDFMCTGSGMGTFGTIFPHYSPNTSVFNYDHAHNDYIELLVESGVAGAGIVLFFAAVVVYSFWKRIGAVNVQILRITAVSSVFTMAVHGIVDFNLHICSNALVFSSILGAALAISPGRHSRKAIKVEITDALTKK